VAGLGREDAGVVRRSELLAAWSIGIDVGMAVPMETGLRVCLIATRLAQGASASPDELFRTNYLALLRHMLAQLNLIPAPAAA
jgi:hypothetical protein